MSTTDVVAGPGESMFELSTVEVDSLLSDRSVGARNGGLRPSKDPR